MEVNIMSVGLIGTNCYILSKNDEALIIDPGGDADRITRLVDEKNIRPLAILLTHAHYDHIGALEELRREFEVDVHINEAEQHWLSNPSWNGSHKLPGGYITASPAEKLLEEGEMAIGSFHFRILHTPGHSPGSMSFIFEETKQIFSGDVLFQQGIGRTDLPGGDFSTLKRTIKEKLYRLDDAFIVYPGHGPSTTIGFEKKNNPFVRI